MSKPSFLIIDGSAYLYRAFHALPPLTTRSGQPTGAIYGVLNMIRKTLTALKPDYVAVVFDPKGETTRHTYYPAYKANRMAMPDELRSQIVPLHTIIQAMGLPLLIESGIEADDVIGTLARKAAQHGMMTTISSGDKDFAQLVGPNIHLLNTMNNTRMDPEGVIEKFGVPAERIIDYLALIGDTSDNVMGVPKVGPKTAVKWLTAYGSAENLVANAHQISGKVGENLRANLDALALAQRLVAIDCALDLDLDPTKLVEGDQDVAALKHWYTELEFSSWLAEIAQQGGGTESTATAVESGTRQYVCIQSKAVLDEWIARLKAAPAFALDTETTGLDPMRAGLVGVSFAVKAGEAAYVPVAHDALGRDGQLDQQTVLDALRPLLEDPNCTVIGQNFKYDAKILARAGLTCRAKVIDTVLLSYMLTGAGRHDLDTLSLRYLGIKPVSFKEVAGTGASQLTFNQVEIEPATQYAAEDADLTLRLYSVLHPKLKQVECQYRLFDTLERPLAAVLTKVEMTGVLIDAQALKVQSADLAERLSEIQASAYASAGREFNLGSPKQLQGILYEELGLPVLKKTPTKQPATSESVLAQLAGMHPLPKLILEYRQLSKLRSTYTEALQGQINPQTHRVHCSYNQAVTSTGRLSSTEPNLQNIPVRTAEGRKIRKAFIAAPGRQLIAADYSQIELRIMAHLSEDEGLCDAFAKGLDIHSATAADLFGIPLDMVSKDQRRDAKTINFGLIYGMSAFGLAQQLEIGRVEAQRYIDVYFERYPGVRAYMDRVVGMAKEHGYVETLLGRRLMLSAINDRNVAVRNAAQRAAINAPMQGTAADMIKLAMLDIDRWIETDAQDVKMTMQVHDELVFEVPEAKVELVKVEAARRMEDAFKLDVPLVVDVGMGSNWDEAH